MRRHLEGVAAAEAAKRVRPEDVQSLLRLIEKERSAFAARDKSGVLRISLEFHVSVAHLAKNHLLERFIRELNERSVVHVAFFDFFQADPPRSPAEHGAVVSALARHDSDAAREAMERHVLSTQMHLHLP